jgi:cytochrome b6-f complex iron-sulfur subunit
MLEVHLLLFDFKKTRIMLKQKKHLKQNEEHQSTSESGSSRRNFLRTLWIGLGILALAEFVGICAAFLKPRKPPVKEGDFGNLIEAGQAESFDPNSVTAFVQRRFYLSRLKDGGFLAISRKCSHLGCTLQWNSEKKQFICPCHASTFDITGDVISPPAPRALDLYEAYIENGIVKVNTGKRIKRSGFDINQVVKS